MKTMRVFRVAAALLLSAAMGSAMVGWAQKPMAEVQQDAGLQEKHPSDVAILVQPDNESAEGQEARQKVTLEIAARTLEVVKGKPYSADASTETVQTLTDGNRIVHRTVSKFSRDSDGRTRREQTFGNVDPEHPAPHETKIFVDDPVNGTAYVLDPGSKSAEKLQQVHRLAVDRNGDNDAVGIEPLDPPGAEEQNASGRMLIKFRDEHSGNPNQLVIMPDEKREVVKEDLGTRTIEGVDCNGTRQTTTIPKGEVGNEKPISIVTETWFAPAIAAVVESTTDDPRYGKTSYRLTNVELNEPARSLFEPPPDFKISVRK